MKTYTILIILLINSSFIFAQPDRKQLEKLTEEVFPSSVSLLREMLSIPNDAHYKEHVELNVSWCEDAFQQRGFKTERIETDGPPLLLASLNVSEKKPTIMMYIQLDGQPVDSTVWDQYSPYLPVLKEKNENAWDSIAWENIETSYNPDYRIFARSASDAKGPAAMLLAAMDVMNNQKWEPDYNIKVIMDFEEELGSPHLPQAVLDHKDLLSTDYLIILDGPMHPSNQPTLAFGARGISTLTLKVHGPIKPQHSGHYGNYIPNPALRLSQLLASMKDDEGRVTIPGFYDGIELDEATKAELARVPDDEEKLLAAMGIASTDKVADNLQESIQYPSLNIRGLRSAWVGDESRTIIPSSAIAEIDVRLVTETSGPDLVNLIKNHIKEQGYFIMDHEPTMEDRLTHPKLITVTEDHSYAAYRTPMDHKLGIFLEQALQRAHVISPVKIRIMGGSIPISPFVTTLNIPAVSIPTVNYDNNQHSPNENIRLGNYKDGIMSYLSILTQPIK